jgi:hypothetical protein
MSTWAVIFLVLAGVLILLKLLYVVATGWALHITKGALFVTTSSIRIRTFLDAVSMNPGERFVDLGCGDGRVLRAACRRYGVEAVGFEVNLLAYLAAKVFSLGVKDIRIRWGSFWPRDLSDANVVFCYLFPDVMGKLANKLEKELSSNARVVSCNFPLPGWHPHKVLRPESLRHGDPIFVYRCSDVRKKR